MSLAQLRFTLFVILSSTACLLVTSYPYGLGLKSARRHLSSAQLERLYRDVGSVDITLQDKLGLKCSQGRMVGVTQMKNQIYLGCSYFHPTEYYEVGVIQVYDAVTLTPSGAPVELELPQDEMLDKIIGSSTNNVVYMITYSYGMPQKSIWTLSFPADTGLEVNFFLQRPATLQNLKVTSDGKIVLHEADKISVFSASGQPISEIENPVQAQGDNTIDVLQLPNGNFILSHVRFNDINKCDLTEVSSDGRIIKSYSSSSSSISAKISFSAGIELLDSGRLLLLNWNNDPDMSLDDSVLVIKTDLTEGQKVVSGVGNGILEFGQYVSYSAANSRLLIGFPYQAVAHAFKVTA